MSYKLDNLIVINPCPDKPMHIIYPLEISVDPDHSSAEGFWQSHLIRIHSIFYSANKFIIMLIIIIFKLEMVQVNKMKIGEWGGMKLIIKIFSSTMI